MGWTTPKTWSAGETLTAANFNTQFRDNLNTLSHLVVRKTADESLSSSTTLQDDNHLILPVAANEVWQFSFNIIYSSGTTEDFKIGFTFPTSGRIDAMGVAFDGALAVSLPNVSTTTSPATPTTALGGAGTTVRFPVSMQGIFTNSSTAGNVTLQWAQNTSGATTTTVYANSTLWAVKLA